jgi:dTMP kinase
MNDPSSGATVAPGVESLVKHATLIAFEGIDGAGKTTAALRLIDELSAAGCSVSWHPNRTFRPVREALDDLARAEGFTDRFEMLGQDFGQLIAAVLKWREMLALAEALTRPGHIVVVDRYIYAHIALAEVFGTSNGPLVRRLFGVFPKPDAVLFLDLDPNTSAQRVQQRGVDTNEVGFLADFRREFRALPEYAEFHIVDAEQPPEVVFAALRAALREVLPV